MNKLFIWIPKCAGTSLFATLYPMNLYIDKHWEFKNEGNACFGHYDVKQLISNKTISKEYWQNTKAFTVVRNPYDRFVSLYNDFLKSGRVYPNTSPRKFATILPTLTRRPGLYNVKDFSQTASQCEWIFPGVEIRRFEDIIKDLPHLNKSSDKPYLEYYNKELLQMVTDLYYSDLTLLNYEILE